MMMTTSGKRFENESSKLLSSSSPLSSTSSVVQEQKNHLFSLFEKPPLNDHTKQPPPDKNDDTPTLNWNTNYETTATATATSKCSDKIQKICPVLSNLCRSTTTAATRTLFPEIQNTLIGSSVFLLYQVVFCLAQAATITRPHSSHNTIGIMAQYAALGIVTAGPVFVWELGTQIPAIYPASDLFLAPFLAQLAHGIDDCLYEHGMQDDDRVFFATFAAMTATGFLWSGGFCILAAKFKLANLGAFLPYNVLCGFFTTIGILMWTLGFSVDVGQSVGHVVTSGNANLVVYALRHHVPSLLIGSIMHLLGPKNPLFVILLVGCTISGSYVILWCTGTSLQEAQELQWFFSPKDLIPQSSTTTSNNTTTTTTHYDYGPPAPFGLWASIARGDIFWPAFWNGIPTILSLSCLYLVRCSLHSAALRKNIPNVTRKIQPPRTQTQPQPQPQPETDELDSLLLPVAAEAQSSSWTTNGLFSNSSDKQNATTTTTTRTTTKTTTNKKKKKEPLTLSFILEHGYGYTQILSAMIGGIPVAPSIAASLTLFHLGAESCPPQYGSCILVVLFYLTNFTLVQYIPKPAFSCLMVLAGLDMCRTWMVNSYTKTKAKLEWMVGPLLVVLAFSMGVLNAIFCGVACSTFLFVANFYNAGAVKFVGNGLSLRSTVERGMREMEWLDNNGDLIQILVVQHYLFFGNSQSMLTYITTMFDDEDEQNNVQPTNENNNNNSNGGTRYSLPPVPKYLIIDFSFVSGMDTSAVDIMKEIITLCESNKCKLFLSGLAPSLQSNLLYAGLKPTTGAATRSRSSSRTRSFGKSWMYTSDMETAMAKAEDGLLSSVFHLEEKVKNESTNRRRHQSDGDDDGFLYALEKIDEQHGLNTAEELMGFQDMTYAIDLEPGDVLVRDKDHGLYFVETGLLRVQWSVGSTITTRHLGGDLPLLDPSTSSISHWNARSQTVGRNVAVWKKERNQHRGQTFRLARIGQGWIIGGIEAANGMKKPGVFVAMSNCRLHHLPHSAIKQAEANNPLLAMNLYRMLSHLATKRQEMTIEHLGQHLRILNSPVPRLRGRGKSTLAKIQDPYGHLLEKDHIDDLEE